MEMQKNILNRIDAQNLYFLGIYYVSFKILSVSSSSNLSISCKEIMLSENFFMLYLLKLN